MVVNILELFSGIGGFSLGLRNAGFDFKNHYYSEIDKHAIANYKYNFKNSKYVGSVTDVQSWRIERPNIITFGSPCQDFSLAGKRKGLDGGRSSLISYAIASVERFKPDIFIWENVKGAYSSNDGADYWAIQKAFANIDGYRFEQQLLNTSWFLPQNRERIYLVGHLTKSGRSFGEVFPFGENDKVSYREKSSEKRQSQAKICNTITKGIGMNADSTFVNCKRIAGCLTAGGNSGGLHSDMEVIEVGTLRTHKDGNGFRKSQSGLCPTIPARAREDGSGQPCISIKPVITPNRIKKRQNGRRFKDDGEPAFTLNCQDQHGVMINESKIRRLTEIECERLQGFPDNWTKYGDYNGEIKEISKTQRYKQLGNAVTSKVVENIGLKLLK